MANIVLDENDCIRANKLSSGNNDVSDIEFYIPSVFNYNSIKILIFDENNIYDVCSLIKLDERSNYTVCKLDLSSTIRVSSGNMKIGFIRIDVQNHTAYTTNFIDVDLSVDNYAASHLTFVSTELNNSISELYQKIVSMTEMNIEIYDKINKENGGGDE
ncbi:hypothetical protein [uncultured Eubacterium sp.]|uniref:hypothetical protein n=1 Tax=uncultured Eubacterium sp. TaxID=165185 RepID=UPI00259138AD|nr:hypothetical protein [uncultured Eubacterium sp.]